MRATRLSALIDEEVDVDLELAGADGHLHPVALTPRRRERLGDGRLGRAEEPQHVMLAAGAAREHRRTASVSRARGHRRWSSRGGPGSTTTTQSPRSSTSPGAVRRARARRSPRAASPACARPGRRRRTTGPADPRSSRDTLPICSSSSSSTTSGRPAARATSSTVRSSCVGPSPPETRQRSAFIASGTRARGRRAISDDRDRRRLQAEADRLGGEERSVAVLPLAADELGAGDDDRRARAAQEVARMILCDVTRNVVPCGRSTRFPFSRTRRSAARRVRAAGSARRTTSAGPARVCRCTAASRPRTSSRTSIQELPALARTTSRAVPFALGASARALTGRKPGNLRALRAAEIPRGDHERGHDRDRDQRHDGHPRLAGPPLSSRWRHPPRAQRRIVLADGEARVVLVDERLAVEAERLRVRAQEAAHVRRRRQDVELLVLERAEVLRTDLRPLLQLGEVEVLTEAGLAEAGADVEHEGGAL